MHMSAAAADHAVATEPVTTLRPTVSTSMKVPKNSLAHLVTSGRVYLAASSELRPSSGRTKRKNTTARAAPQSSAIIQTGAQARPKFLMSKPKATAGLSAPPETLPQA